MGYPALSLLVWALNPRYDSLLMRGIKFENFAKFMFEM